MSEQPTGAVETRKDAGKGPGADVKLWVDAIAIQDREEEAWRKAAQETIETYRDEKQGKANGNRGKRFNILFANIETQLPAIYNSAPAPDVRRRFADEDEVGKIGAQIIERALSYSLDAYDFDGTMQAAVLDMLLPGRGVARVRYNPITDASGNVAYETATCEHVPWQSFRRGPGRRWEDVPWVSFDHHLTRDQLVELSPEHGKNVALDTTVSGAEDRFKDVKQPPDLFMRAYVREVWDKEKREVLFIAPGYAAAPLRVEEDPLGLEGFFPTPRPLYAVSTTDTLVPIEEYRLYKDQAEELDLITRRIAKIVAAIKARGVYAATEGAGVMESLQKASDGELVPVQNLMGLISQNGGIDKAIWMWPIDTLAAVLKELYVQREQIKQAIFEITGLADIMRGSTESSETATAQQIKAQWGSLRVQRRQADVARFARDLLRLKAEIISTKFSWQTLEMVSGIRLPTQADKQMAQQALMQAQAAAQQAAPQ
jgi:hypothetical protein